MRILFLTGQVPYPPQAGGALRTYGLLDGLHRAGHTLDLLTLIEPEQPDPLTTPLADLCTEMVSVFAPQRTLPMRLRDLLLSGRADMERRSYSPALVEALKIQLKRHDYDLVQIESLEMASYLPAIRAVRPSVKTIYDSFNAEFELQRYIFEIDRRVPARLPGAIYSLIQWQRLTHFERRVCQQVNHVIAVSEADAQSFRWLAPHTPVSVVPNGIHTADYTIKTQPIDLGPAALLFTGTMNYRPNVDAVLWFVENVLGEIRKIVPEARLFVVGNKPHGRLDALRQRSDVEITGYVQDVLPFLHSAAVYIAPLRMGSGTRLKLLQAMAAHCAIVSTRVGAQGLDVVHEREMMLADDRESFARTTIDMLRDPALRERLANTAYQHVCSEYDWVAIVPRLLNVYREMGLG